MGRKLTVSEIARKLNVNPRVISDGFYARQLSDEICPIVNGRRRIPEDYIPVIESFVAERNATLQETTATC